MRIRVVTPLVALSAGLLLAGCGSSGGVAAPAYAHQVCTALGGFEKRLTTSAMALQTAASNASDNPAQLRAAALDFANSSVTNLDQLQTAFRMSGYPQGSGGKKVADRLSNVAQQAHDTLAVQAQRIAAIPASASLQFQQSLQNISAATQQISGKLIDGLNSVGDVGSGALNTAFRTDKTCSSTLAANRSAGDPGALRLRRGGGGLRLPLRRDAGQQRRAPPPRGTRRCPPEGADGRQLPRLRPAGDRFGVHPEHGGHLRGSKERLPRWC